jgi:predicted negative regulator of RcsB-dependent stress response
VEEYRTEEEQVEALRRWWSENGRSIVASVVIALSGVFGWQAWQANELGKEEQASDMYLELLRATGAEEATPDSKEVNRLAEDIKSNFKSSTYAQFAALQLAALAVNDGKLSAAEQQLRWVLGKAAKESDTARVAQLRLARVLASSGDVDQALVIIEDAGPGSYGASYAAAQGDMLLSLGRDDEARNAYSQAVLLARSGGEGLDLALLQQKLQSLSPLPTVVPNESESIDLESVEAVPSVSTITEPAEG